ncbi:Protein kinase domain-containing protein ppk32 [Sporothrix eucalyptigena]|uniref:Protein kinase domain-containing protein ppk32 n=1 Tax=Sporothrix eucalyptigena TaxID=1812306 RepID=A0ABP0AL46_9PEZI
MFSNAFKSISSTINSGYTVAATPTSTAGPWKIYDAKKKSTGKAYSVFVFDRKSLDAHASSLGRSGAAAFKRAADEVVERLKKEASSLARLRHPSILELVEPVEETRGGGLQFATEAVTASLSSLLQEKDEQEGAGSGRSRASRYVTEDADGVRRRREIEIDELEIQKGLLQLGKALEFLHENAGLVHGNLTPDAVLVNAKSDWKISGLSFCGPAEIGASGPSSSFQPVSIHEILNMDARLPRSVQLNLDYASPDLVMDNNLTPSADMFSLGLLCVALYNSPHRSPIEAHASVSTYKRAFSAAGAVPSTTNNFLSSRPLPRELAAHVLPRLIARRPAQRLTAKEFQTSEYFDNILVSTIRFLDAFPAKTHGEKSSFMRGLNKVLPSFPKSVMEKKVLPGLLDEMKDRELAPQILQNIFKIVELLPSAKRVFSDRVLPCLKEHFLVPAASGGASANKGAHAQERDPSRDASLMVVLDRLAVITANTTGKEFKDDVLPIVATALESPTPAVVDAALRSLPAMLPILDFSTIKHELFPVVAAIFSKTSSLAIKIRGLQAFVILCGGSADGNDNDGNDGLDGLSGEQKRATSSTALDKYTMQEKIVPLIKAIKTKEPAVMMEALNVLRVVGNVVDADFVAFDLLPVLWTMSLGPLLNLKQFQAFMKLIKTLSARVEEEQVRKLQELSGVDAAGASAGMANGSADLMDEFSSFGGGGSSAFDMSSNGGGDVEDDFERLVKGKTGGGGALMDGGWDSAPAASARRSPNIASNRSNTSRAGGASAASAAAGASAAPAFSWSTPAPAAPAVAPAPKPQQQQSGFRTVTPDLGGFAAMTPSSTQFSKALPARPMMGSPTNSTTSTTMNSASSWSTMTPSATTPAAAPSSTTGINWGAASRPAATSTSSNTWSSPASTTSSGFSLPPPPGAGMGMGGSTSATPSSGFSLPPPPGMGSMGSMLSMASMTPAPTTTASTPNYTPNYNRANLGGMSTMGGMGGMGSMNSMSNMGSMMQPTNTNTSNGMGMGMGMNMNMGMGMSMGMPNNNNNANTNGMMATQPGKTGLDKYESLL